MQSSTTPSTFRFDWASCSNNSRMGAWSCFWAPLGPGSVSFSPSPRGRTRRSCPRAAPLPSGCAAAAAPVPAGGPNA
eukprot:8624540-Pyramimonas_sp.AAC.1